MVIAFQIILLVVILLSFIGVMGERENMKIRTHITGFGIAGMAAFIVSVLYL